VARARIAGKLGRLVSGLGARDRGS
jgi:hypothetical protein